MTSKCAVCAKGKCICRSCKKATWCRYAIRNKCAVTVECGMYEVFGGLEEIFKAMSKKERE